MKIILSPSKKQKFDFDSSNNVQIHPSRKTEVLFTFFKTLSKKSLKDILKIKNKLLDNVYKLYQSKRSPSKMILAIACYQGVAFKPIDETHYSKTQRDYMNKHLVILSAMYGPLKPDSPIWPYRLDMTIKPKGINLYEYWQPEIDEFFQEEDYIINLASNEFSKMLKHFKGDLINIHFKEEQKDHTLKTSSYHAKKARGMMVNELILKQVNSLKELKKLTIGDYDFNSEKSTENNIYFIKSYS
ncbi:MAG: YaaA family protein [Candidatus Izimaplasma sp.]|nr:YaaA family protein [Candidatus Izimaplasma bacterium]